MRNKTKISVAILILVLFLGFYIQNHNRPNQVIEQATTEQVKVETKEKKSIQEILREQHKSQQESEKTTPIQVTESVYDEDPVVDANLIIENNKLCISYLTYDKNKMEKYLKRFESILNTKQADYYKNFYNYCQQLNKQHPEYHLSDLEAIRNQKKHAQANSMWGRIIKGEIDVSTLSDNDIAGLLKQNNPNILKQAPKYLSDYYAKVIHWDIEDVLNNHQYDYTQLILQYAHQLYLCQLGNDCSSTSSIMAQLCYFNAKSCGLDYPQFVQQALTAGQQADVQLAIGYLKNIYQ